MRKIRKPTDVSENVYVACVNIVRDNGLRNRLIAAKNLIGTASGEFDSKASRGNIHTIARENTVNGNITKKELEEVYTLRMARKGAAGRPIYDRILLSAELGICPLCSHREATTIDHYLPKTEYPRLTVTPINLLPCCKDCNDIKDAFYPRNSHEELIHPYYDDIETDHWLTASIQQSVPCTFIYSVSPPDGWPHLLSDRVRFHFAKLQLSRLYATQAAVELSMIRAQLSKLLNISGIAGVKAYLSEGEETRSEANKNSWQAVFYRTAMNDDWFCSGGFQ